MGYSARMWAANCFFIKGEAALLAVGRPALDRCGPIGAFSVHRAEAGTIRTVLPAALTWVIIERGLAPLLLRGAVGATAPGVAAPLAAAPRHHAAAAAVSDARGVVRGPHAA